MLTLYGAMASRAHRSVWMLKELGVPFRHEPVSFLDGSTGTPEFLAINPNGRVPVLRDDDFVIYESMAINLYLARRYSGDVGPRDWREDALAVQWSFWVVTEVEKPLLLASANRALFAPQARCEPEAEIALHKLARPWTVLDQHLSRQPWLLGDRFTVADLNVATVMDLAPQCASRSPNGRGYRSGTNAASRARPQPTGETSALACRVQRTRSACLRCSSDFLSPQRAIHGFHCAYPRPAISGRYRLPRLRRSCTHRSRRA